MKNGIMNEVTHTMDRLLELQLEASRAGNSATAIACHREIVRRAFEAQTLRTSNLASIRLHPGILSRAFQPSPQGATT